MQRDMRPRCTEGYCVFYIYSQCGVQCGACVCARVVFAVVCSVVCGVVCVTVRVTVCVASIETVSVKL